MSITLMWHLMVLMKWMHLWTLLRSPQFHLIAHFSLQSLCSYVPNTISSYLLEDFALTTVALSGWRSCTHHGEGSYQLHIRRALLGLFYLEILHCMLERIAASWWFTEKCDLRNWREMTWWESLCVGGGLNCKTMCYSRWPNQSGSRAGSNIPSPGKEWHCTLYFVSKFGVFCSLAPLITFSEHGCDFCLGNRLRFYNLLCLLCSGHSLALGEVTTHPLIFYHCNIWYFSCYWVLQSWNLLDPMDLSITGSHANCWMKWEFMESLKLEDPCSHANK